MIRPSRRSTDASAERHAVDGDVVDAVRRLKDEPGPDLLLGGGAELLAALSGPHLIDDYRLLVTPTALGQGKAMFQALETPLSLRLTGTRTFSSGSVLLEYQRMDR